ncbi:MAG: flagellar basal body P-ring protein FlgI [Anderseniella sp.]
MKWLYFVIALVAAIFSLAPAMAGKTPQTGPSVRIKDITTISSVRDLQLVGYGLVIGLNGTGDSARGSPFTTQSIKSMLDRLGVNVPTGALRAKNVAAVVVTANLPSNAAVGSRIDVSTSSLGDATSLRGGMLVMTLLTANDGNVYSVAQGPISVGGFTAEGESETLTDGVPTSGRIPNGAHVERALPDQINKTDFIALELNNPDFSLAVQIADLVNEYSKKRFNAVTAKEKDARTVMLKKPPNLSAARFLAEIGTLFVVPDEPAVVVVDERTGTIVIGKSVRISTVAVTHGSLTVRVTETPAVSQPEAFSDGRTTETSETSIFDEEPLGQFGILGGTSLQSLVQGLNQMGLKPKGIIAILQAIKSAGALHSELIIQ